MKTTVFQPRLSRPRRYDIGGFLGQVLPPLTMSYIPVTKAPALDTSGVRAELEADTQDKLKKAQEDAAKLWEKTLEKAPILAQRRIELSQAKDAFLAKLESDVRANPYYLSSPGNQAHLARGLSALAESPVLQQYADEYKGVDEWWKKVEEKGVQGNYYYGSDKQFTGQTNQEFLDQVRGLGPQAAQALRIGRRGPGDSGGFIANTRFGTFDEAAKKIDALAAAVGEHTVKRGGESFVGGGESLNQMLHSQNGSVVKVGQLIRKGGNEMQLAQLAGYLSQDPTIALSHEDQEALDDQFSRQFFQQAHYQAPLNFQGRTLPAGTAKIGEAWQVLPQGSKERQAIDEARKAYVKAQTGEFIKNRILHTGKGTSIDENESTKSVIEDGQPKAGSQDELLKKVGINMAIAQQAGFLDWTYQPVANADNPDDTRDFAFTVRPEADLPTVENLRKKPGVDAEGKEVMVPKTLQDLMDQGNFNPRLLNNPNIFGKNGFVLSPGDAAKIQVSSYVGEGVEYGGDVATKKAVAAIKEKNEYLKTHPDLDAAHRQQLDGEIQSLKKQTRSKPIIRYRISVPEDVAAANPNIFYTKTLNAAGKAAKDAADWRKQPFVPKPAYFDSKPVVDSNFLGYEGVNSDVKLGRDFAGSMRDGKLWTANDRMLDTDIVVDFPSSLIYADKESGDYWRYMSQQVKAGQSANPLDALRRGGQ